MMKVFVVFQFFCWASSGSDLWIPLATCEPMYSWYVHSVHGRSIHSFEKKFAERTVDTGNWPQGAKYQGTAGVKMQGLAVLCEAGRGSRAVERLREALAASE